MNKGFIMKNNGITLIALVITIIVLLILAGVSISMLIGNNGILNQAINATIMSDISGVIEQSRLDILAKQMENDNYDGITEEEYIEILEKYGSLEYTDTVIDGTLTTKKGNKIKVSDIYDNIKETPLKEWDYDENGNITNGRTTLSIGDYINYDAMAGAEDFTYTSTEDKNGNGEFTFNINEYSSGWRLFGVENGKLILISASSVGQLGLSEQNGYKYGIEEIEAISKLYGQGEYAAGARAITINDINALTGYNPNNTGVYDPNQTGIGTKSETEGIEYGAKVTYTWSTTSKYVDYSYISLDGSTVSGTCTTKHTNGFIYWNGSDFITSNYSKNEEIITLTNNVYVYYINTLTEDIGETVGGAIEIDENDGKYTTLCNRRCLDSFKDVKVWTRECSVWGVCLLYQREYKFCEYNE